MRWWREAKFGMFIHWGLYSVPAGSYNHEPVEGYGEWIMHDAKIPVPYYAAYVKKFDPEQFNADRWVSYAKAAGMKYIVMTAKHHEGFAMYHSGVDNFNIYDATNFKRDPIAEMAAACKKAGIKFGVYYSQNLDWHHPGGGTSGPQWDSAQSGAYDSYIKNVAAPQVRELLTKYHPAVIWWDIPSDLTPDEENALTAAFPEDPGLISNNRMANGVPGDYVTPEQYIPAKGSVDGDWETCMTINDTWGYKSTDTNFKTSTTLIRNLIDIASKGGNYLLNVGPTSQGVIPAPEVERLKEMGAWMTVNGASIYGAAKSPFKWLPFYGRCTQKANTLYLHVFEWPQSGLVVKGLKTTVVAATAMEGRERLPFRKLSDGSLVVRKPSHIDPTATVIELRLAGLPKVIDLPQSSELPAVRPGASVPIKLSSVYNCTGIYSDGKTFRANGGLDGDGSALPASLLSSAPTPKDVRFILGPADTADAVSCERNTVPLPTGKYSSLWMVATATNGPQNSQPLTVTYADGTKTILRQDFSDWFSPGDYEGEFTSMTVPYRKNWDGSKDNEDFHLYVYAFNINRGKTVRQVILPNNRNVKVFALSLAR